MVSPVVEKVVQLKIFIGCCVINIIQGWIFANAKIVGQDVSVRVGAIPTEMDRGGVDNGVVRRVKKDDSGWLVGGWGMVNGEVAGGGIDGQRN